MRVRWIMAVALCAWVASSCAWAQAVRPGAISDLLRTLEAPGAAEHPVVYQDDRGFVRFLGAPAGGVFQTGDAKAGGAAAAARIFVESNRDAFGLGTSTTLVERSNKTHAGSSFVKFSQLAFGVTVYGADLVVQVNGDGDVLNVVNDVARDLSAVESGNVSTTPGVGAAAAGLSARKFVDGLYDKVALPQLSLGKAAELFVFQPSVLGQNGPTRLVWRVEVVAVVPESVRQEVLVDASSGEVIFHFSKLENILDREIFDYQNRSTPTPTVSVRDEDGPATGINDVDNVYDILGDVYNFYQTEHDRDSYDDEGSTLTAFVRYPVFNAFWTGSEMLVGTGLDVDDVIAHEMTHGVTQETSDLIYFGFSGAINESFSDIWGEFVDLSNGRGNDSAAVRWFLGEDVDINQTGGDIGKQTDDGLEIPPGAIRYMKDPTVFGDPDRLFSPNLASPTSFFDNGGVHINSGIGNKLAYLLTDGGSFNGQTIRGLGISRTADLFYGTQFLLSQSADYFELYLALGAVAAAQGYSFEDRLNIAAAGRAVEIEPSLLFAEGALSAFRAIPTRRRVGGQPVISLSWTNPPSDVLSEITLVRSPLRFPNAPTDGVVLYSGKADRFLDTVELQEGVTYYYTVFAELTTGFPQFLNSKATVGGQYAKPLIEPFGRGAGPQGTTSNIDLAFSQLTFTPVGPARGNVGSDVPGVEYEGYELNFTPGVAELPIARDDAEGGSTTLALLDEDLVTFSLGETAIPFFGRWYSQLSISSNGSLSFQRTDVGTADLSPTLADALAIPRIAFLYTDLNPAIGGEVWIRDLSDRLVVTFDNVPQFLTGVLLQGNSAQVELFYTGTIRITYGQIANDPRAPMGAICGLSDGKGVAQDPAVLFPLEGLQSVNTHVDLSSFPQSPTKLSLTPQASLSGSAGDRFAFTAQAVVPATLSGVPLLFAEWNGPGVVPFADNGDGSGTFSWPSGPTDNGIYTVRVKAVLGAQQAYQDVRILVGAGNLLPTATNLRISTGTPFEDPTVSRFVGDDRPLTAGYTYVNPLPGSAALDEGGSVIIWLRNSQSVPALFNAPTVSANLTVPGDQWYFRLIPVSESGIAGTPLASPVVTIAGFPDIQSVTPNFGSIHGGDLVRIRGTRMRGALKVTFGGIEAAGIRAISDTEIEVTTPVHVPGTTPIAVTTSTGTGSLLNAFTFLGEGGDFPRSDVNADGRINATDVQLVINAVLELTGVKGAYNGDANNDGAVNSGDVQAVVNSALYRN